MELDNDDDDDANKLEPSCLLLAHSMLLLLLLQPLYCQRQEHTQWLNWQDTANSPGQMCVCAAISQAHRVLFAKDSLLVCFFYFFLFSFSFSSSSSTSYSRWSLVKLAPFSPTRRRRAPVGRRQRWQESRAQSACMALTPLAATCSSCAAGQKWIK